MNPLMKSTWLAEGLEVAGGVELDEFGDDGALCVVLGIVRCAVEVLYDVGDGVGVESAETVLFLYNLAVDFLEAGVETV